MGQRAWAAFQGQEYAPPPKAHLDILSMATIPPPGYPPLFVPPDDTSAPQFFQGQDPPTQGREVGKGALKLSRTLQVPCPLAPPTLLQVLSSGTW